MPGLHERARQYKRTNFLSWLKQLTQANKNKLLEKLHQSDE